MVPETGRLTPYCLDTPVVSTSDHCSAVAVGIYGKIMISSTTGYTSSDVGSDFMTAAGGEALSRDGNVCPG